MATKTTNYNLTKPAYDENADIKVINDNMDIIDAKMKEIEDAGGGGGSMDVTIGDFTNINVTGSGYHHIYGRLHIISLNITPKSTMSSGNVIDAVNIGAIPLYEGETFVTAYDNTTNRLHALVLNAQGIVKLKALNEITTSGKVRGVIVFIDNQS